MSQLGFPGEEIVMPKFNGNKMGHGSKSR
jgi:hypothetical protein